MIISYLAPPRKHPTDQILDAVRALVLADGPRAASVVAIAHASGAPAGTLYHRFGNRDGVLTAAWLRALERFQAGALAAGAEHPNDPVEAGVAMAVAVIEFATEHLQDARLLLVVRRGDLLDGAPDDTLLARLDAMNAPLERAIEHLARGLRGRADARAIDAVTRAVVDLPTSAIRRHARGNDEPLPGWLVGDVADAARTLLTRLRR